MIQFTNNREKFSGGRWENISEGEINFYIIFSISLSYIEKAREPGSQALSGPTTLKQWSEDLSQVHNLRDSSS